MADARKSNPDLIGKDFLAGGDIMGSFGGFYKGEKRKQKKEKTEKKGSSFGVPTFTMPEIISKKKKQE